MLRPGDVAEWLGRGLQNLVRRFESARHLNRELGISKRQAGGPSSTLNLLSSFRAFRACNVNRFALLMVAGVLWGCGEPRTEPEGDSLSESIHQILSEYPEAEVGISLRDPSRGLSFDLDPDSVFHAASTMKVPVMIEVFRSLLRMVRMSLDDSVVVTNEFKSIVDGSPYSMDIGEDSDDDVYGKIGNPVSVGWLVERMIAVSSNLATNILIDLVNADSVQKTIESLGTATMRVYRGVEDMKAYNLGLNNTATSGDLATLMLAIAEGRAVSPSADSAMVEILLGQEFNDMIPAGLPANSRVAHKTGWITRIDHDAAIVYPADRGPYVLVILTRGIDDKTRSAELGAKIAAVMAEYVRAGDA